MKLPRTRKGVRPRPIESVVIPRTPAPAEELDIRRFSTTLWNGNHSGGWRAALCRFVFTCTWVRAPQHDIPL
eukprot:6000675-Alexandrium_andersonii.AAC.1